MPPEGRLVRLVRLNIHDSHQSVEFPVTCLAQRTLSLAARGTLSLIKQVMHGA